MAIMVKLSQVPPSSLFFHQVFAEKVLCVRTQGRTAIPGGLQYVSLQSGAVMETDQDFQVELCQTGTYTRILNYLDDEGY